MPLLASPKLLESIGDMSSVPNIDPVPFAPPFRQESIRRGDEVEFALALALGVILALGPADPLDTVAFVVGTEAGRPDHRKSVGNCVTFKLN